MQKEETSMKIPNKINDGDVFIMTYERYLEICLYTREGNLIKTSLRIGYPKDQVYDEEGNVKGYKSIVVEQIISNVL